MQALELSNRQGTKASDDYRYERKFVVSELSVHEIEMLVKLHPAMFFKAYPPRFVNNVYFDSPGLHNYGDNIDGVAERVKCRVRWYGDLFGAVRKPVLEFKIKQGLVGTKQSYVLAPFFTDPSSIVSGLADAIDRSTLPKALKHQLTSATPTLLNRYWRQYYQSSDRGYRITLDSRMEFYRIGKRESKFLQCFRDDANTIVELKYDRDKCDQAESVANHFPFRMTKNSKYVNGLDGLY